MSKEYTPRFSRPRCGSSPSLARRALEAGYPVSSLRGQDSTILRSGTRHSEHHAEDARSTASSYGIVVRKAYPQVPPKSEYSLTTWGQSLCPALDAFLKWADLRPQPSAEHLPELTVNTNASGRKDGREQRRSKH